MNIDRFRFRYWCEEHQEITHRVSIDLVNRDINYFCMDGNWPHIVRDAYKLEHEKLNLMQCTGLKDCNGALIYENDILGVSKEYLKNYPYDMGPQHVQWVGAMTSDKHDEDPYTSCGFYMFSDRYPGTEKLEIVGHIFMLEWSHLK